MDQSDIDEGTILICTQTFDHNEQTIPAGEAYHITNIENIEKEPNTLNLTEEEIDGLEILTVEDTVQITKITLELANDNTADKVCRELTLTEDQVHNRFRVD